MSPILELLPAEEINEKNYLEAIKKITVAFITFVDREGSHDTALLQEIANNQLETNKKIQSLTNKFDQRFEKMDNRFEKMDQRFEKMDNRFEKMDQRFEQMDHRFEKIEQRMGSLENEMKQTRIETVALLKQIAKNTTK